MFLSSLRRAVRSAPTGRAAIVTRRRRRVMFETLEDRRLLAVTAIDPQDAAVPFADAAIDPDVLLVVDTLEDEVDMDLGPGKFSLREAISIANLRPGADRITFADGLTGSITLVLGQFEINEALTIQGPHNGLVTIDANEQSRIFGISMSGDDVTLSRLKLIRGRIEEAGGAILSDGANLFLEEIEIRNNAAAEEGGGIYFSDGNLSIVSSTLSDNSAGMSGGGIFSDTNLQTQTTLIRNSTISDNRTWGVGGGLYNFEGLTQIHHSTITANESVEGGSGVASYGDGLTRTEFGHSIIAGNIGNDVAFVFENTLSVVSQGFNLFGSGSAAAAFTGPGDQTGISNPMLGPLADNGGLTQTHALLANSPAIDAGDPAFHAATLIHDQRGSGFGRVFDGNGDRIAKVDIGAFEFLFVTDQLDFGDAPAVYPVTLANDGARHRIGALFLGATVDAEVDGQPSTAADADSGDDGVFMHTPLVSATVATISSLTVISSNAGKLDAWIDFNNDGDWNDSGEQIFASTNLVEGENLLSFTVPAGASIGSTGARFRLSSFGRLSPTGEAANGEVEDYIVDIIAGTSSTILELNALAGVTNIAFEGEKLSIKKESQVLFEAPLAGFGVLNFVGSAQDDIFQISGLDSLDAKTLNFDGGLGNDVLNLIGAGQILDLTAFNFNLQGIEGIDITGTGNNALVLNVDVVKAISATNTLRIVANFGDTIEFGDGWKIETPRFIDGQYTHVITESASDGTARIEMRTDRPLQNPLNRFDADRNGIIHPLDALRIINAISRRGIGAIETPTNESEISSLYFDVSGDRNLTALDALQVINAFARLVRDGESEGESLALLLDLDQFSIVAKSRIASDKPEINDAFSVPAPRKMVPENMTIDNATSTVATIDEVMTWIGDEDDEAQGIVRLSLEMERFQ